MAIHSHDQGDIKVECESFYINEDPDTGQGPYTILDSKWSETTYQNCIDAIDLDPASTFGGYSTPQVTPKWWKIKLSFYDMADDSPTLINTLHFLSGAGLNLHNVYVIPEGESPIWVNNGGYVYDNLVNIPLLTSSVTIIFRGEDSRNYPVYVKDITIMYKGAPPIPPTPSVEISNTEITSCTASGSTGYGYDRETFSLNNDCPKAYDGNLNSYVGGLALYSYILNLNFNERQISGIHVFPGGDSIYSVSGAWAYFYNKGIEQKRIQFFDPLVGDATGYKEFGPVTIDSIKITWRGDQRARLSNIKEVKLYGPSTPLTPPTCAEDDIGNEPYLYGVVGFGAEYDEYPDQCLFVSPDNTIKEIPSCENGRYTDEADYDYYEAGKCNVLEHYCDLEGIHKIDVVECSTGCINGACICTMHDECPTNYECDNGLCVGPECGNGVIETGEECDSGTGCLSDCSCDASSNYAPYDPPQVDCQLITTQICGNDVKEGTEICDGTDLDSKTCIGINPGFTGGTLACATDCTAFDVSGCIGTPVCIDGCWYQDRCLPIGTRLEVDGNGEKKYCDIDGQLKIQVAESQDCDNGYECESNVCIGICFDLITENEKLMEIWCGLTDCEGLYCDLWVGCA